MDGAAAVATPALFALKCGACGAAIVPASAAGWRLWSAGELADAAGARRALVCAACGAANAVAPVGGAR